MARWVSASCPKCGAGLKIGRSQHTLNCPYCGATSLLEGESVPATHPAPSGTLDQNKWPWILATGAGLSMLIVIVAFALAVKAGAFSTSSKMAPGQVVAPVIPLDALEANHTKNATVVIQMFGDYECPFTARAWSTMGELLAKHPGNVRLVWRNLPRDFHPHAVLAAEAALEAKAQLGEDGFWKMTDLLLSRRSDLDQAGLERQAANLGMNIAALRAAWRSGRHQNEIKSDETAAKVAGVGSTPTFLIGDVHIVGAQPLETFETAVSGAMHKDPPH